MKKIKTSALRKAIRNNLFETTYNIHTTDDKIAGKLGDDRDEDLTVPEPQPIQPLDQTAAQLSRETYPIEDSEWSPENTVQLAGAVEQIARGCPEDQLEFFYTNAMRLKDQAQDRANNPKIGKSLEDDDDLEPAIKPKERKMSEAYYRKLKRFMKALDEGNFRNKDFARKWKQGDDLNLGGYPDRDDYDEDIDGGEFVPDIDDLRDFMEDNPEADITKVPGAQEAIDNADPMTLEDLIATGALPNVRGPSGARQYIERTIFDIFRMDKETLDAVNKFSQSDWAKDAFVNSMKKANIFTAEEAEALRNEIGLTASAIYREWLNDNFIQPAIRAYRDTPKKKGLRGKELVDKIQNRWEIMSNPQRSKASIKSATNLKDFMSTDAGRSVSDWSRRAPTKL